MQKITMTEKTTTSDAVVVMERLRLCVAASSVIQTIQIAPPGLTGTGEGSVVRKLIERGKKITGTVAVNHLGIEMIC